jgi:hypothetical protein
MPEGVALDRAVGAMLGVMIGDSAAAVDGRIPGQPGPDGESALAVARALVAGDPLPHGGGLLRLVPLAIHAADPRTAAAADAARTGADPACCVALTAAIAAGVGGADETEVMRLAGGVPAHATLAAALRGAACGRQAFSPHDTLSVLTCRPDAGLGVAQPRPEEYWPDDLLDLAEALLRARPQQETA